MNPGWISAIINVEGAFLQGRFENGKELYTDVPDGFVEHYSGDVVLQMNVPMEPGRQSTVSSKHLQSMSKR
jgi:hypothetical protein